MGWCARVFMLGWIGSLAYCGFPIRSLAQSSTQSILILDQSVPVWPYSQRFLNEFRTALSRSSKDPINLYVEFLDAGRFGSPEYEDLLKDFLQQKYKDRHVAVIFTIGTRAFDLLSRASPRFASGVPIVFISYDDAAAASSSVPPNVTGIVSPLRFRNLVRGAKVLVPGLRRIALVGDPFERQPFRSHYRQEMKEFAGELEFIDLSGQTLEEIKASVAALPDDTVIAYTVIYRDRQGSPYNTAEALRAISAAANRPIVVDSEVNVGPGGTGGYVLAAEDHAREAAHLVAGILSGEAASKIPVALKDLTKPVFDDRELKRWAIADAALPQGSEIRFRARNVWDLYRPQILAVGAVVLLQSAILVWLLIERQRRRSAEAEARRRLVEMAQMDRALTVGAMSASLAHELYQPLSAILSNAEAAEMILAGPAPDLAQVKEILADVRRDDQRAADIIRQLRAMLNKSELAVEDVDLEQLIVDTVHILKPEATARNISLVVDCGADKTPCRANPVYLQQVMLNLGFNAMDAMKDSIRSCRLTFQVSAGKNSELIVSVADTGSGIPEDKLESIFEPLFTTKQQGTGLGLSIARTIIDALGGKVWAENRAGGGAVFHFTLPRPPENSST